MSSFIGPASRAAASSYASPWRRPRALRRCRPRARDRPRREGVDGDARRKRRRRSRHLRRRSCATARPSSRMSPTSSSTSGRNSGSRRPARRRACSPTGFSYHHDFVAEIHDTHHPISTELYYEDQKKEAKARTGAFLAHRAPKYLGYFEQSAERQSGGKGARGGGRTDHRGSLAVPGLGGPCPMPFRAPSPAPGSHTGAGRAGSPSRRPCEGRRLSRLGAPDSLQ